MFCVVICEVILLHETQSVEHGVSFCFPSCSPVLISGTHGHVKTALTTTVAQADSDASFTASFSAEGSNQLDSRVCNERVLQTMKWGLVPSWQKEPQTRTLLNNCRYEGMMEKASFRNAINKRQRCVVLVDG